MRYPLPSLTLVFAALLVAASALPVARGAMQPEAALQDDSAPTCRKCSSTGLLPCGEHAKDECALEHETLYCSAFDGCEPCAGLGFIPCTKCENLPARSALEARMAKRIERKAALEWMNDEMKRPLRMAESEHFVLVWELDRIKVNKKLLNGHEALHLYLRRFEELYDTYVQTFSMKARDFAGKPHVFVWWLPDDQADGSLRFTSMSNRSGSKLLGNKPRYSVLGNQNTLRKDEQLHRNLVHNLAHLLLSNQHPSAWLGGLKSGWLDAGLAHWFEDRLDGRCTNYCYQEQNTLVDFKGGKWKPAIRKMVAAEKEPPLASLLGKNTDQLTPPEHAVSMSLVDYLIAVDASKFPLLVKGLKAKKPAREVLKSAYDLTPISFQEKWRAWVLETYPTR